MSRRVGPHRNRVTPMGDLVAAPLRGAWTGNRGILHDGTEIIRFHRGPLWIICALSYRGWRQPQWVTGHFTSLFFHDEALALAAGHRPCALCRRDAYVAYGAALARGLGTPIPRAADLDRRLHAERLVRGTHQRRIHDVPWSQVPAGAFAVVDDGVALVLDEALVPWSTRGYGARRSRPRTGTAHLVTPPTSTAALAAGYRPQIDPTALP